MFQSLKNIYLSISTGTHFMKASLQLIYGSWKISKLPQPIVSIFGGSHLQAESIFLKKAHQLSHMLVEQNISVVTGGGPGIMESATCGAAHIKGNTVRTMAIGVAGLKDEKFNECVKDSLLLNEFFARKYLLINYSLAFVIFPGGFGTMDELSDLLNLMQTGKLKQGPVILIGTDYWKKYLDWIEVARSHDLIVSDTPRFLTVTDNLNEVVQIVDSHCTTCVQQGITHLQN